MLLLLLPDMYHDMYQVYYFKEEKRTRKRKKKKIPLKEEDEEKDKQDDQLKRPPEHQIHQNRYIDIECYRSAIKINQIIFILNIQHTRLSR